MTTKKKSDHKENSAKPFRGLGPKSTQALAEIGIHTIQELKSRDLFEVYRQLKETFPGTSLNFLYGLIAAVEDRDWREVQRSRRSEILLRLDEMGIAPK